MQDTFWKRQNQFVASASRDGPDAQYPAVPFQATFPNVTDFFSPFCPPTYTLNTKKLRWFAFLSLAY